jgi:tetratricopeptide (TPR) repeat protein
MRLKLAAIGLGTIVLGLYFLLFRPAADADSYLRSFYVHLAAADFESAKVDTDKAIQLSPGNARYYGWRGYVLSQKLPSQCSASSGNPMTEVERGLAREAIADYRRVLERNSHDAIAHHNLAWLEHLLGDNSSAAQDFREAAALDPGTAAFSLSYGMFLEEMGNTQESRRQYEIAIELSPSILESPFFSRYRTRFPADADAIVAHCIKRLNEEELKRGQDPILEARLGKVYEISGDLARASDLLKRAASKLPNLPLVWLNLGEIYERQGDYAEATKCYRKANVIDGALAGPYFRMGLMYLRDRQNTLATHDLQAAATRWEHAKPITASHNNRLYAGTRQPVDDLLPTTLVWYTCTCEASAAYRALADLVPPKQRYFYDQRAKTCEQIPAPHGLEGK